jgi:alpha-amylase
MKTINIVFGIHNHQPVGNFDYVFESAYQKSYKPFLDILEKYPRIKLAQHYTGILLEWLEGHHPKLITQLKALVKRGQVEMMTGGFYEPILAVIPDEDKIGQIKKLTEYVKKKTGYKAQGMWLAERIWEPHLPKTIRMAGVEYTVIDDSHFKYAGLKDDQLLGYYVTEESGVTLNIFPISQKLRYTIPFQHPNATIEYLKSIATEDGNRVIVFADDGEKFGVWPDTYKHVYENKWLETFFKALTDNSDWIKILHFSEVLKKIKPIGRIYLPTASYSEMMHWALFPKTFQEYEDFEHKVKDAGIYDKYGIFVRGGFWRNFMSKYPEVNNMHKKMLRVSEKVNSLVPKAKTSIAKKKIKSAEDHLWAGQCNCPYWHGVFGGLYLSHIRSAIYKNLISAENIVDSLDKKSKAPKYELTDFDRNDVPELIIETDTFNLYFDLENGGSLFELDYKPKSFNVLDIITRREEGYHKKLQEAVTPSKQPAKVSKEGEIASIHDLVLSKEPDLHKYLFYDWYRKGSFIDHFFGDEVKLENFMQSKYGERGNFVNQPYKMDMKVKGSKLISKFSRDGSVWNDGQWLPVRVMKTFTFKNKSNEIICDYKIQNLSEVKLNLKFGVEFAFTLLAGDADDRYYYAVLFNKGLENGIPPKRDMGGIKLDDKRLRSNGEIKNVKEIGARDDGHLKININWKFDKPANLWRFPIETISLSEAGFERVYQGSVIFPHWSISLSHKNSQDKNDSWSVKIIKSLTNCQLSMVNC